MLHARKRIYYLKCDFTMKNVKSNRQVVVEMYILVGRQWTCIKLRVTLDYRITQRFYATSIEGQTSINSALNTLVLRYQSGKHFRVHHCCCCHQYNHHSCHYLLDMKTLLYKCSLQLCTHRDFATKMLVNYTSVKATFQKI